MARLTRIGFQVTRFSALKTKLVKEEVTSCARQNSGYAPTERLQLMNVTSPAARNSIPMIVMSHIQCWMQDVSAISSEVLLASLIMAIKRLSSNLALHTEL